ncbi:FHA domain-containing protein [Oculatella sp. LEGE 06141]|uniref:FHA domain-containing protein n=1 Tax=Oculatella sp. LEGE 06141 TaxID=1828648 RepID=UPI00188043B6|nr:FHA domain-containing protein [Oculatella sp. LEGE 06141]MBE9180085.1 FHA domain-containing protein [Oculatella sp. LEGE 06141]
MLRLKSVNFEQQQFQKHHLDQTRPDQMEWSIGRHNTCDVVLPSPEVSRVHGRIVFKGDAYHFIDVGSTSGSLLNGEVISANDHRLLHTGDLLQIGETFLYVEEVSPPTPFASGSDLMLGDACMLTEKPWTDEELVCRCSRIIDETADVKTFCFIAEPSVLFSYKPGQFANLKLEIDGKSVIRPYSISSSPSRPCHLSLTVKRVPAPADQTDLPPGLVSNWLHDHLKVGDRVKLIGGPMGHFTCLPNLPAKMLLISAGSGITPMMSMSRWVQDTIADCDIVFLHSARTPKDIVFHGELETMAAQLDNFRLAVTMTQPTLGQPWMGFTGRISESMLHMVAPDLNDRAVFVCGPNGFMQGVKSTLEGMNYPMEKYQEESFGGKKAAPPKAPAAVAASSTTARVRPMPPPAAARNGKGTPTEVLSPAAMTATIPVTAPAAAPAAAPAGDPAISFAKSGQEVAADGNTSILELAEQEGVEIRNACRVGACGACKVHASQGEVRYDTPPMALTAADQKAGYVLACVAYPVNRVVVEA